MLLRVDLADMMEAAEGNLGTDEAERTPGALQWGVLGADGLSVARVEVSEGRSVADEALEDLRGCRSLDEVRQWGRDQGVPVRGRTLTRWPVGSVRRRIPRPAGRGNAVVSY